MHVHASLRLQQTTPTKIAGQPAIFVCRTLFLPRSPGLPLARFLLGIAQVPGSGTIKFPGHVPNSLT